MEMEWIASLSTPDSIATDLLVTLPLEMDFLLTLQVCPNSPLMLISHYK